MSKSVERRCEACGRTSSFRLDQKTCGCVKRGEVPKPKTAKPSETSEVSGDQWTISLPKSRIHTLDELVTYFEIDLSEWEISKFVANKWEVAAKNAENELAVEPLFQVKAWLQRRVNIVDARKEIEELKELTKKHAPKPRPIKRVDKIPQGNLLEIDLFDHHWGKLAWPEETGHKAYDTKIAANIWWSALDTILQRSSNYKFDEIWLPVGNDILNSDDMDSRTTKGTHVNSDTRYQKTFSALRTTVVETIELLREKCNVVRVIMVSGNHDYLSVWHLGDSLEAYFHNYTDVDIDNSPRYYKYKQYGSVMVMYTHGDKGKRTDYPLLMATEQPEMFGSTKYHEIHVGHKHFSKLDEFHGVRVRMFASLSPPDAWHAENAFVGNLRTAEGLIWNRDEGLIGTVIYTDSEDENV